MFERFTERARQVVVFAQEEARTLEHNYIGTEHILLAILRAVDGPADAARSRQDRGFCIDTPLTPRAALVLEWAREEASLQGSDRVDLRHLILGLAREGSLGDATLGMRRHVPDVPHTSPGLLARGRHAGWTDAVTQPGTEASPPSPAQPKATPPRDRWGDVMKLVVSGCVALSILFGTGAVTTPGAPGSAPERSAPAHPTVASGMLTVGLSGHVDRR